MDFNAEPLTDDFSDARTDAAGYDVYCEGTSSLEYACKL